MMLQKLMNSLSKSDDFTKTHKCCARRVLCAHFTVLTCILPRDTVLAFSSELRYGAHFLLRTAIQRSDIVLLPPWHPHEKTHLKNSEANVEKYFIVLKKFY